MVESVEAGSAVEVPSLLMTDPRLAMKSPQGPEAYGHLTSARPFTDR
jgi:hypothetical protein